MRTKSWLWTMFLAGVLIVSSVVIATRYGYFRASAQEPRLQYGNVVEGQIEVSQKDQWFFDGSKGDVVTIRVEVEQAISGLIPAVRLTGPEEMLMVATEAPGSDAPRVQFSLSLRASGTHAISITGASGTTGSYTLSLSLDQPSTMDANEGTGITGYGRTVYGTITDEHFRHFWAFQGGRGDVIDLRMIAVTGDLDGYLSLIGPDGGEIVASDTGQTGDDAALLAIELPSSGTYTIVARRAGAGFGERGTTQGEYELALSLRTPGINNPAITPIVLLNGDEARGRLTADAPSALFETGANGVLAFRLEFTDLEQIGTLAVMTTDRVLLDTVAGTSPLEASVSLANVQDVWVEVSTTGLAGDTSLDFSLTAYRLPVAQRAAEPLRYGQPISILDPFSGPDSWYFWGNAGESVVLGLSPYGSVLNAVIEVTGPDGEPIIEDAIHAQWEQAFVLTQDGPYELRVNDVISAEGYQIRVDCIGVNGFSFDQMRFLQGRGTLIAGTPVSGELSAGGSDLWYLSAESGQEWRFVVSHPARTSPLGLMIQQPDGTPIATTLSSTFQSTAQVQVSLPRAGLYRAVIFEPTFDAKSSYTLSASPTEGGTLEINVPHKGTLTPNQSSNIWDINLRAESLLQIHVDTLTPNASPAIHVVNPNGHLVASTYYDEGQGGNDLVNVPVVHGGSYRIMIAQTGLAQPASYRITISVARASAPETIPLFAQNEIITEWLSGVTSPTPQVVPITVADALNPQWTPDQGAFASARAAELDTLIRGEILPQTRYQVWSFTLGGPETIIMSTSTLDVAQRPSLTLIDSDSRILAESLQNRTSTTDLIYRFSRSGTYYLIVQFADDTGGRYTLSMNTQITLDESLPGMIQGHVIGYGETYIGEVVPLTEGDSYLFYGATDDVISISVTTPAGDQLPGVQLLTAMGDILETGMPDTGRQIISLNDVTLDSDSLYQVTITPSANQQSVVRYAVYLSIKRLSAATERGSGPLNDQQVSTLSANNSTHRWLFDAQAGERVSIHLDPLSAGAPSPLSLTLTDSMGNAFLYKTAEFGQSTLVLDQILLPRTGIYQAVVKGGQQVAGDYRISLSRDAERFEDGEGALSYGKTDGKVLTQDNYLDIWTFAGSRGDVVSVSARTVRGDPALLSMQLRTHTGQVLGTATADPSTGTSSQNNILLPFDGHYSLIVGNPDSSFIGESAYEVTVRLNDTSARSMGTVISYGEAHQGRFFADDNSDIWLFEGRQAETVSLLLETQDPDIAPSLNLVSTDWQVPITNALPEVFASIQSLAQQPAQLEFQLPVSGTYALYVQNQDGGSGQYQLSLNRVSASTQQARALVSGLSQTGQIGDMRLVEFWTFQGEQHSTVSVRVLPDSRTNLAPAIQILAPDQSIVAQVEAASTSEAVLDKVVLPATGSYEVRVTRALGIEGETHGSYTLQMDQAPSAPISAREITFNQIEGGTLGSNTPSEWWSFTGQQGQVVRVRAETTSGTLDPVLRLYDQAGMLLAANDDLAPSTDAILLYSLPADASYKVQVSRYGNTMGATQGNYILAVELIYQDGSIETIPSISYGDRVTGSIDSRNPSMKWTFFGHANDVIQACIEFPIDDAPLMLTLNDPSGNQLAAGVRDQGAARIENFGLPAVGYYVLEVRRPADARSAFNPYTLDLSLLGMDDSTPLEGGFLILDESVTGVFGENQTSQLWSFEGQANTAVNLMISRLSGPVDFDVTLFMPDGTMLYTASTLAGATHMLTSGSIMLPVDGIYMLMVAPRGDEASGTRYRLSVRSRNLGAVMVPTLIPGQDGTGILNVFHSSDRWEFSAQEGDTVALRVAVTAGNWLPELMIMRPDGTILAQGLTEQIDGLWQASIDLINVPETGTYSALVSWKDGLHANGQYRIMLRKNRIIPRAALAQDIAYGQPIQTTAVANGDVYYAIQGVAGDVIGLEAYSPMKSINVILQNEAGDPLMPSALVGQGRVIVPAVVLPESGRYLIHISLSASGPIELVVVRRALVAPEGDTVRTLSRSQTLAEGILAPAQMNQWNFPGRAGEVLSLTVDTTGGRLQADLTLYGPTGYLAGAVEQEGSRKTVIGPIRLPVDGEYRLMVGSWRANSTGSYSIRIDPADPGVSGSSGKYLASANSVGYGGLIAEDTQDAWTFDGQAGEIVGVRAEQTQGNGTLSMELSSPDGLWSAAGYASTAFTGAEIGEVVLPMSGRYTLTVSGQVNTGDAIEYRLGVIRVQTSIAASLRTAQGINYGEEHTGKLDSATTTQSWVFFGQRGDTIHSVVTPITPDLIPEVYLIDPQGTVARVVTGQNPGAATELSGFTLKAEGYFGLVVTSAQPIVSGSQAEFSISLERLRVPAVPQGRLSSGRVDGLLTPSAPIQSWELQPAHNGTYHVSVEALMPGTTFGLAIYDLDGQLITLAHSTTAGTAEISAYLTGHERTIAVVDGGAALHSGRYTLRIEPSSVELDGGNLSLKHPDTGLILSEDFTDTWEVVSSGDEPLNVVVQAVSGDLVVSVSVFDATGTLTTEPVAAHMQNGPIRLPVSEDYTVLVSRENDAAGHTSGEYTIMLEQASP